MIWKQIPTFPAYEVSERGDVRRVVAARGGVVGRVLRPYVRQDGYDMFILRRDGCSYHRKAHQLVAEAFIGPKPFPAAEVCHGDGSRTNNHYRNLRWGSSLENKADMMRHGRSTSGERHARAKLTARDVAEIRQAAAAGERQADIGARFGIRQSQVSRIVAGRRWKTPLQAEEAA